MADVRLSARPFPQQVEFFRRKLNVPTAGWTDLWREHHAHGFMVAGAFRADLLEDLRLAVHQAIESGTTLQQFKQQFGAIVDKHGWSHRGGRSWRARVIYDTNVRQSFNAGRWAQLTSADMQKVRPYGMYRHNDKGISKVPRPLHLSWNGLVLPLSHPWWKSHAPQNGWGCKCGIRALSDRDLARMGKAGPDIAPDDGTYTWVDPRGTAHQIPNGIDPGFDYNVGEAALALPAARRFGERIAAMPPAWRARALADAQARAPDWHSALVGEIDAMLAARAAPRGRTIAAGMLREAAFAKAVAEGIPPATVTIAIADHELAQMVRGAGQRRGAAIDAAWLRSLPLHLASPDVVLYDRTDTALVYAWRTAGGRFIRMRLQLDGSGSGAPDAAPTNWIRAAEVVARGALTGQRYELVEGRL